MLLFLRSIGAGKRVTDIVREVFSRVPDIDFGIVAHFHISRAPVHSSLIALTLRTQKYYPVSIAIRITLMRHELFVIGKRLELIHMKLEG